MNNYGARVLDCDTYTRYAMRIASSRPRVWGSDMCGSAARPSIIIQYNNITFARCWPVWSHRKTGLVTPLHVHITHTYLGWYYTCVLEQQHPIFGVSSYNCSQWDIFTCDHRHYNTVLCRAREVLSESSIMGNSMRPYTCMYMYIYVDVYTCIIIIIYMFMYSYIYVNVLVHTLMYSYIH